MSDVLVDTCIWSLALRGKIPRDREVTDELTFLIKNNRAKIIGSIRQEILSGYSNINKYKKLRDKLRAFPNEQVVDIDYECAAGYSNICRSNGIQGSHTDFLICAVANRLNLEIYTKDKDFDHYASYLPIALYQTS